MRAKITGELIASIKGPFEIWDEKLQGLSARRQTPEGRVTYRFRYVNAEGRKVNVVIGDAASFRTPDQARREAKLIAGQAESARRGAAPDPVADRDASRRMPTVAEVWADYKQHVLCKKRGRTPDEYERNWLVHIEPRIGSKRIDLLTSSDVETLHLAITEQGKVTKPPEGLSKDARKKWRRRGGPVAANRCRDIVSALCSRATIKGWIAKNPAKGVEENPEYETDIRFSDPELLLIQRALLEESEDIQIAFGLFLETPVRHQNVAAAEADEFVDMLGDDPVWRIPGAKLKGGKPYEAHISPELARKIDAYIERNRAVSPRYLFPLVEQKLTGKQPKGGRSAPARLERRVDPDKPRAKFQSAWERIQARALELAGDKAGDYRALREGSIHTFKHTYLSGVADLGASAIEVQTFGDHADIRTSMKYVHHARARVRDLARQRREKLPKVAA